MLKSLFFSGLLCISLLGFSQNLQGNLDRLLSEQQKSNHFSGMVLVAKNGEIEYTKGMGWADAEKQTPIKADSPFMIASITKAFTAVLIMQLEESGHLSVEESIADHLPELAIPQAEKITIHHLLTNTSGLRTESGDIYLKRCGPIEMLEKYVTKKPLAKPGKQFQYNNLDFVVLGLIIEKLYQKSWAEVLQEKILTPLEMNKTGIVNNDGQLRY